MSDEQKDDEAFYKSKHYYDLKDALLDVQVAHGKSELASTFAKLTGKTLFNTGLLAGKAGLEIAKNIPSIAAGIVETAVRQHGDRMPQEQVERHKEFIDNNKGKKLF